MYMYIEICDDITMKYKITMILVNNNLGRKILPERKNALICDEAKIFTRNSIEPTLIKRVTI